MDYTLPILVFDSGLGGVSVLREAVELMPAENFLYFGDSKNAPYGTKDKETVKNLTMNVIDPYIAEGIKGVLIACNTATSAAVRALRDKYKDIPIVGIEPAVKPASIAHEGGRVLVLATPMTIAEKKLSHLISQYENTAEIIPLACPGLMEFVEDGITSGRILGDFLSELLTPYIGNVDAVVLGCTHYPFVKDSISKIIGGNVEIFDGGLGTAKEMRRRLEEANLLNPDANYKGSITYKNSDPSKEKEQIFYNLLHI